MKKISCMEARQIDLVSYLASLGYQPQKVQGADYWYCSPLREEKTPSFKVNRNKNLWYDHGTGQGGDIIDFGTRYFKSSVSELLDRLASANPNQTFSFHPPANSATRPQPGAGEKEKDNPGKIIITATRPLEDRRLLEYLESRCIPVDVAHCFCKEVDFTLYDKEKTAIGFANDAGGYELRSEYFKGSSSPKSPTTIDTDSTRLTVFEGFFDFLSYQVIAKEISDEKTNFLILNSLAFFYKPREAMEKHQQVNLYLDRNKKGIECTSHAIDWDKTRFVDRSILYRNGQDLNEWLKEKHSLLQKPLLKKILRHEPKKRRGLKP
ncbi:MAG: CHC2 zinc finger domain-containing protein [Chitinophagaceae bacterium]